MIEELEFAQFVKDYLVLGQDKDAAPVREAIASMLVRTCEFIEKQYETEIARAEAQSSIFQYRQGIADRARETGQIIPDLLAMQLQQEEQHQTPPGNNNNNKKTEK